MKKILTILSLVCISITINAQTDNKVSYVSKKKDTLMLPNNELGKLIASTWKDTPSKEKKPTIVFADETTIKRKNDLSVDNRRNWRKEGNNDQQN